MIIEYDREFAQVRWSWDNGETWKYVDVDDLILEHEDLVHCKDCKHYKQSAVADRKMCFRKDVDGIEVCYDFLPYDSCTYGERKDEVDNG